MNIKETMQAIHANNVQKGFWDKERNTGELLMLVVSELSEALEADRKANYTVMHPANIINAGDNDFFMHQFKSGIKDSFEDEIADAVIRLFDLAEGMNIDLESHITAKMRYNAGRETMHGKKY